MEEVDKGCLMIRMGVSGECFFWYRSTRVAPGQRTIKWLCVCVRACVRACVYKCVCLCKCCESVAREHNGKVEHLLYLVSD